MLRHRLLRRCSTPILGLIVSLSAVACGGGSSGGDDSSTGGDPNNPASGGSAGTGGSGGADAGGSGGVAATGGSGGGLGGSGVGGSGGGTVIPAPLSDWKNVVIGGGGYVTGVIYHPADPGLLYARTDMGGAYRWDSATQAWVPLLDWLGRDHAHLYGVLSLAVDAQDPTKLYAMTGTYTDPSWAGVGSILRSSDNGQTWERVELSGAAVGGAAGVWVGANEEGRGVGERLQVDPNLGSTLLMGTTKAGLWKSTDSGSNWTQIISGTALTATTNINFVLFDPSSGTAGAESQRVIVSTTDTTGSSLLVSQDGGATFTPVAGQPTGVMALRPALNGSTLYLTYGSNAGPNNSSSTGGGVYKVAIDATSAWSFTDVTPPDWSNAYGGVSVDPADPDHVVVSTLFRWDAEDIYRTTDGGANWQALGVEAAIDSSENPHVDGAHIHWITDVKFNPGDTDELSFITGQGYYRCTGVTSTVACSFDDLGLEELVPLQLISPPSGAPVLSAVGDRDGFRHDDLTVSPPRFSPNKGTTRSLAFAEALSAKLVKTFDTAPFGAYSNDSGDTWTDFASYPSGAVNCDSYFCGNRSIAISADGSRIVWSPVNAAPSWSADDGATWTACAGLTATLPKLPPKPIADRVNPNKFYAFDVMSGVVYSSTDGGTSFTAGTTVLPHASADWAAANFELSAVFGQEGHLWVAASDGNQYGTTGGAGLFRSTDSGATFTRVAETSVSVALRVGFGAAAPGAAYPAIYIWGTVDGVTGIFRSVDEGATWVRQNDDAHQFGTIHVVIGDPKTYGRIYVAAEGRGILYATKE